MSVIATALKHLIAAGVSGDDLVRAVAEMEAECTPTPTTRRDRGDTNRKLGISYKDWLALRNTVFIRDNFQCVYCGTNVVSDPQCDHVIPLSQGGETVEGNLATSCKSCNSSKKDRLVEEWLR